MQAVKNKRNAYENARKAPALGAHDGGQVYDGARRSNAACEINVKSRRVIEGRAGKSKRRASDAKRPASDARGYRLLKDY